MTTSSNVTSFKKKQIAKNDDKYEFTREFISDLIDLTKGRKADLGTVLGVIHSADKVTQKKYYQLMLKVTIEGTTISDSRKMNVGGEMVSMKAVADETTKKGKEAEAGAPTIMRLSRLGAILISDVLPVELLGDNCPGRDLAGMDASQKYWLCTSAMYMTPLWTNADWLAIFLETQAKIEYKIVTGASNVKIVDPKGISLINKILKVVNMSAEQPKERSTEAAYLAGYKPTFTIVIGKAKDSNELGQLCFRYCEQVAPEDVRDAFGLPKKTSK